jgi:hypothetical protein
MVAMVTRFRAGELGIRIPLRASYFFFSETSKSLLFNGYRCCFFVVNRAGPRINGSRLSSAEVKNECSCNAPAAICLCCMDRHNFTIICEILLEVYFRTPDSYFF